MKFTRTNKYDAGLRAQLGIYAPTVGGPALPSGDAALALVKGEKGSALKVAETMGLRAALVAAGLACAGIPGALLLRGTLGAVLGIEAGVLAWAYTNKDKSKTPALPIAAGGYDPRYGRFHVASPWGSR
jgi:hypothetical protein